MSVKRNQQEMSDIQEKRDLITRNLKEVIGAARLDEILKERPPVVYWGTAPTSTIHIAYLLAMLKISDLLKAGCKVKILFADLHATLDAMKSTLDKVDARTVYYKMMIIQMLTRLNIDTSNIEFVTGKDFQYGREYTRDMYWANSMITVHQAQHAGAEVVKQNENPVISTLLYPTLQALDLHYLGADVFLGGNDQRRINTFGLNLLPKLGYTRGIFLMTEMVPGLSKEKKVTEEEREKMSASVETSKIDLLDPISVIKKKINTTYCLEGDVSDNPCLVLIEKLLFPVLNHLLLQFVIKRKTEHGGDLVYENCEAIKADFASKKLHPMDLKLGCVDVIEMIIAPIREAFENEECKKILKEAYS